MPWLFSGIPADHLRPMRKINDSGSPGIAEWQEAGQMLSVGDRDLFVVDVGEGDDTLCILHGYPTCSYDYYKVLPILAEKYRVIIHDHPGFGLSGKPQDYSYSLIEQAETALALWHQLGLRDIHIIAHDYGTSVATEIIARHNLGHRPVGIQSVVLGNGSMLIEMARLLPIQKLIKSRRWGPLVARLSTQRVFLYNMRKLWYDRSRIDEKELKTLYRLLWHGPTARKVFPVVSRYLDERRSFWHRWIGGLGKTPLPILILWADRDPVAVIAMAHRLHSLIPNSTLRILEDIGHYPMLEAPVPYSLAILEWMVQRRNKEQKNSI